MHNNADFIVHIIDHADHVGGSEASVQKHDTSFAVDATVLTAEKSVPFTSPRVGKRAGSETIDKPLDLLVRRREKDGLVYARPKTKSTQQPCSLLLLAAVARASAGKSEKVSARTALLLIVSSVVSLFALSFFYGGFTVCFVV
jgi:hypothetical protein